MLDTWKGGSQIGGLFEVSWSRHHHHVEKEDKEDQAVENYGDVEHHVQDQDYHRDICCHHHKHENDEEARDDFQVDVDSDEVDVDFHNSVEAQG